MKNLFKPAILAVLVASMFSACQKDGNIDDNSTGNLVKMTLKAGNPEIGSKVRTEIEGLTPYWSVGDVIGVSTDGTSKNYAFKNDATDRAETTTFSGSTNLSATIYAYYPYTANGIGAVEQNTGAKVDLPANQSPSATSFDGKADILVSKPLILNAEGQQVTDLEFRRLSAIVKVVLKDQTTGNKLNGQHVSSLSLTSGGDNTLAGRVVVDLKNFTMSAPYYNGSNKVTATYTTATQYVIDNTNATYLSVFPRLLASGSTLTVEAITEGYSIKKEITLPGDVNLETGKITTLNINLSDANLTAQEGGLALPFIDDYSWITAENSSSEMKVSDYPKAGDGTPLYSATAYTFQDAPALKLGSSKNRGYFTTTALDLSQPFSVLVKAKTYGSDESGLKITIGKTSQTASLNADYTYHLFKFDAQGAKETVRVDVTGTRGHIAEFKVLPGQDITLPPVINITTPSPLTVPSEGDIATIGYSIENPVDGVTISADSGEATWIHDFDYSIPGEVTFIVDENTGSARSAVLTLTYATADAKIITINQPKPNTGEAKKYTFTIDKDTFTSINSNTGYAAYNGDHTFTATAIDGSGDTYDVVINTNQIMTQSNLVQFQTNKGTMYNKTNLNIINSVTISINSRTFNVFEGTSENPSTVVSETNGTYTFSGTTGYLKITGTGSTPKVNSITITFTI